MGGEKRLLTPSFFWTRHNRCAHGRHKACAPAIAASASQGMAALKFSAVPVPAWQPPLSVFSPHRGSPRSVLASSPSSKRKALARAPECCVAWQALADNLKKTAFSGEEERKAVLKARKKHMGALGAYVAKQTRGDKAEYVRLLCQ